MLALMKKARTIGCFAFLMSEYMQINASVTTVTVRIILLLFSVLISCLSFELLVMRVEQPNEKS